MSIRDVRPVRGRERVERESASRVGKSMQDASDLNEIR
jgi:hypothetical protein